jgi:hypothetical protein
MKRTKTTWVIELIALCTIIGWLTSCKASNTEHPFKINLHLSRPALNDIASIEGSSGGIPIRKSYKISVAKDYFPNADKYDLADPILFIRDTANIKTLVSYYFTKEDSIVRLVSYSWDYSNKRHNYIEDIFNHNQKAISQALKNTGRLIEEKEDWWWQKTIIWDTRKVHVKQFMFGGEEEPHRTRVLVSWK